MLRGRGPLEGSVSTQKALQGSETETSALLDESSVSPTRAHKFALQANNDFLKPICPLSFEFLGPLCRKLKRDKNTRMMPSEIRLVRSTGHSFKR